MMSDRKSPAEPTAKQRRKAAIEQATALLPPLAALIADYGLVERDWARSGPLHTICKVKGRPFGLVYDPTSRRLIWCDHCECNVMAIEIGLGVDANTSDVSNRERVELLSSAVGQFGANMGLTIDPLDGAIVVADRSGFVAAYRLAPPPPPPPASASATVVTTAAEAPVASASASAAAPEWTIETLVGSLLAGRLDCPPAIRPLSIAFSADGQSLFVVDTNRTHLMEARRPPPGSGRCPRTWPG
jgi:hypothetical protein